MKKIILFLLLISPFITTAQPSTKKKVYKYYEAEKKPEYPGGLDALKEFFSDNIKYPPLAKEQKKQGKVFIKFVVKKDGSIDNIKVLKTFHEHCSKEAIKVAKKMKVWQPGELHEKKVSVEVILPVEFVLPKEALLEDDLEIHNTPKTRLPSKGEVFEVVEFMPEYSGGRDSLAVFIAKHLNYPKMAIEAGKEGTVYLRFVVEPSGRVTKIRVLKTFDKACTKEAIRVIRLTSGKWKPGKQRGKKVRVNVVQPIKFKLNNPTPKTKEREVQVFTLVQTMPEYVGGEMALHAFIKKNLKYPKKARKKGIEGRVFVQFVVDKEGKVTKAKILKGIGYGCDEEALRVINKMPKWEPATYGGKPVSAAFTLPFSFKLK